MTALGHIRRLGLRRCLVIVASVLAATMTPTYRDRGTAGAESTALSWWALGDSYSSGEGIPGTEAPGQGEPQCSRASGVGTDAKAWAVVARDRLSQQRFSQWAFVPCTGAISSDVPGQVREARTTSGTEYADLITLSMGGNDVFFADIIAACIDLAASWSSLVPGCDVDESTLRGRVDMLVGTRDQVDNHYRGLTLPVLYDRLASTMRPGGVVVVMGYPQLVEEPTRWESWRRNLASVCSGVQQSDVPMLRSAAAYLNEQTAIAVDQANQRWASRGVRFEWRDLASGVYETSEDPDHRHGLCSRDAWINGITTGLSNGDFRTERSFHPTQAGHTATGEWLASWLRAGPGMSELGPASRQVAGVTLLDYREIPPSAFPEIHDTLSRSGVSTSIDSSCSSLEVTGWSPGGNVDVWAGYTAEIDGCPGDSSGNFYAIRNNAEVLVLQACGDCESDVTGQLEDYLTVARALRGLPAAKLQLRVTGQEWSIRSVQVTRECTPDGCI
jgi:hypothetical protein